MKLQYLKTLVENQDILINVMDVEIISQLAMVYAIPGNEFAIEGAMNYRGKSVPVVSLTRLLELNTEPKYSEEDDMVVCTVNNESVCLLVNETVDVVSKDTNEIQMVENSYDGVVKGMYIYGEYDSWVLDVKSIVMNHKNTVMMRLDK
ncbi:MAG: chemotaxis protein CheW [Francisellaceae bacterium]|nr:chemotaxis protein CheW [Francisellaceae bacterium]